MTALQHSKALAILSIIAFVAVLAPGVIVWILRAAMILTIAGCVLAFIGMIVLIGSLMGGGHG
jgi:hypothetical protein